MAVTTQNSAEFANTLAVPPINNHTTEVHGRVRAAFVTCDQVGVGDAGSSFALFKLPAGRVRFLGHLSRAYVNWTTALATLDLGWDAYVGMDGATVAADDDGLVAALDVDTVGFRTFEGAIAANLLTGGTFLFESKSGVTIRATSNLALVAGDDLVGCFYYIVD